MTPFKAVYGRDAINIHEYHPGSTKTASIESTLLEHDRVLQVLKDSLNIARVRIIKQANKKHMDKEFDVGEWVYLRLQPNRQQSVATRKDHKLSKRFFGPYLIRERIGTVAYRLQLPTGSRIHPIFHVSLLKKCYKTAQDDEVKARAKFEEILVNYGVVYDDRAKKEMRFQIFKKKSQGV